MKEKPTEITPVGAKRGQITVDLSKPDTLVAETERKLFGFKCEVREGTLAERECERRIWTYFSVLAEQQIKIVRNNAPQSDKEITELISMLIEHLRPIYRSAEKELSTKNILLDIFEYFQGCGYTLLR